MQFGPKVPVEQPKSLVDFRDSVSASPMQISRIQQVDPNRWSHNVTTRIFEFFLWAKFGHVRSEFESTLTCETSCVELDGSFS